jgi:hypothetical protein
VNGDEISEISETFWLNLSNPVSATLVDSQGQGTILDDDAAGVSVEPTMVEVAEGGNTATYTIKLTSQPTTTVTINVIPDSQINAVPPALNFTTLNWNVSQTVTITAIDDTLVEGPHLGVISHTVASADANYNNFNLANITASITDNDVEGSSDHKIYLPLIFSQGGPAAGPDLVVQKVLATGPTLQLVIKNQGNAPVADAFWVDLYLNPNPIPTGVNQLWDDGRSTHGAVWGVTPDLLPALTPTGVLTLTVGDAHYWPSLSNLPTLLPAGTIIYGQVDSANLNTPYGGVLEIHEMTGQPYNNVSGPVSAAAEIGHDQPGLESGNQPATSINNLPPRPE